MIGSVGVLRAECHPIGVVVIDGREFSARSEHGAFIAAGTSVEILSAQFGEMLVRAESADAAEANA